MPIYTINQQQIAFIHIPKTGGTTIENILKPIADNTSFFSKQPLSGFTVTPQHLTFDTINELLGNPSFQWSFAIVRDPYERMESEFFYRRSLVGQPWYPTHCFSTWVKKTLKAVKTNPCIFDNHIRPQIEFINDGVTVFKFESGFDSILQNISTQLSLPSFSKPEKAKQSKRETVYWSKYALEAFNQFYKQDIEHFGYSYRTQPPLPLMENAQRQAISTAFNLTKILRPKP